MLNTPNFYPGHTKNILGAFGSLFNDLQIVRTVNNTTQTINVPIAYGSSDKAYSRKVEDPGLNYNMKRVTPRMSFLLKTVEYDYDRKIQQTQYIQMPATPTTASMQLQPVPYNLTVDLYISIANIEDGLQIIEQILPFFNPEFTIKTKDFPSLNIVKDTPVILTNVEYQDNTPDSTFEDSRELEWTLTFTIKTFMFGPVSTGKVIKDIKLFYFDGLDSTSPQIATTDISTTSSAPPAVSTSYTTEP